MPTTTRGAGPLVLRLYVAGTAPNSLHAIRNLKAICDGYEPGSFDLEIVDLLVHPARALDDGVIVTPTLIKVSPLPAQKIIGTLHDAAQVLLSLGSA